MSSIRRLKAKFINFYMNSSIRWKILLLNLAIILFMALTLGLFSYQIYSRSIIKEISLVNLRDTRQIKNSLETLQKDINELSTYICLDRTVQNLLTKEVIVSESTAVIKSLEPLSTLLASKDAISFISVYGLNGLRYYISKDGSTGISEFDIVKKSPYYQRAIELKGRPFWTPLHHEEQIFITNNQAPKVAMFRSILDMNTYQVAGFMMITINLDFLEDNYLKELQTPGSSYIITDENNKVMIFSNSGQSLNEAVLPRIHSYIEAVEDSRIVKINNQSLLLTYSTIANSRWKVLYLIPTDIILKPVRSVLYITLIVVILCTIISFGLSMFTSSVVTKPLQKLLSSMDRVKKSHFKEKVNFIYNDEIGKLGQQYNEMIDNLNQLVNKVYKLQLREKEAELKALQAQINPHFLYNTLDTIFWMAEKAGEKAISQMIYALSKLFRLTLNRGNEITSVRNEKELLENYILLQKKRFKDKLTYRIEFDESMLELPIPKLILQPFVENAIIHGTEENNEETLILVTGHVSREKMGFIIEDNGSGMDEETLQYLLHPGETVKEGEKGYAIHNVRERLALYYDEHFELNIESAPWKGTRVKIIIPKKLKWGG